MYQAGPWSIEIVCRRFRKNALLGGLMDTDSSIGYIVVFFMFGTDGISQGIDLILLLGLFDNGGTLDFHACLLFSTGLDSRYQPETKLDCRPRLFASASMDNLFVLI